MCKTEESAISNDNDVSLKEKETIVRKEQNEVKEKASAATKTELHEQTEIAENIKNNNVSQCEIDTNKGTGKQLMPDNHDKNINELRIVDEKNQAVKNEVVSVETSNISEYEGDISAKRTNNDIQISGNEGSTPKELERQTSQVLTEKQKEPKKRQMFSNKIDPHPEKV